jgi:D-glycerate 3-kinase
MAAARMSFDPTLIERLLAMAALAASPSSTCVLGLSGAQGSGKSTLAAQLVQAATAQGKSARAVSLDDFYLDLPQRQRLAAQIHPLFVTRGVPGTHDIELLRAFFACLRAAAPLRLPRFDKGSDRRVPESEWERVDTPLDLLVFEGWCLGVEAQTGDALRTPVNALEAMEDADGVWRRHVNHCLARDYPSLWAQIDRLAMLRAPSFAVVAGWRDQAEAALRARGAVRAMSPEQIARFIGHYQRLTEHAMTTVPTRAQMVMTQNTVREVIDVIERHSEPASGGDLS